MTCPTSRRRTGIGPYLLSSSPAVDSDGATVNSGAATINQQDYLDSVYMCSEVQGIANINCARYRGEAVWADYNVPRGYSKCDSWVGFSGRTASDCDVVVEVLRQDGTKIFSQRMPTGDTQHVVEDLVSEEMFLYT